MRVEFQKAIYTVTPSNYAKIKSYQIILFLKRIKRNTKELLNHIFDLSFIVLCVMLALFISVVFCYKFYHAEVEALNIINIFLETLWESRTVIVFTFLTPILTKMIFYFSNKRKQLRNRYYVYIHCSSIINECLASMYPGIAKKYWSKMLEIIYRYSNTPNVKVPIVCKDYKLYLLELKTCFDFIKAHLKEYEFITHDKNYFFVEMIKVEALLNYMLGINDKEIVSEYMFTRMHEKSMIRCLYEMVEMLKEPWYWDRKIDARIAGIISQDDKSVCCTYWYKYYIENIKK